MCKFRLVKGLILVPFCCVNYVGDLAKSLSNFPRTRFLSPTGRDPNGSDWGQHLYNLDFLHFGIAERPQLVLPVKGHRWVGIIQIDALGKGKCESGGVLFIVRGEILSIFVQ